jgi:ArsR family transcriptional regulator
MDIYELHADICKTLASPTRLKILNALATGELTVGEIVGGLEGRKANISQHLAVMRVKGILEARRQGAHVYYRIANPKVVQACQIMREVLLERLEAAQRLAQTIRNEGI